MTVERPTTGLMLRDALVGVVNRDQEVTGMEYKKALNTGHERADAAAEMIRRWAGVDAYAVCALRPGRNGRQAEPVGERSFKDIARDDGFHGNGQYHLVIVDEKGATKACTKDRFPLDRALRLAKRLPVGVAVAGWGELSSRIDERHVRGAARDHALHIEV